MERKANYVLIGLFTFAVIASAFGFVFWIHHTSGKKQSVTYRVIFDTSVSGLRVGGPVLFNGIRVGEVTQLKLNPEKPSEVEATLQVNKATPIRSDTHVGLEFTGLTGIASVSLRGVSATTPLLEREEGEPPTLKADASASQDLMQAVRDTLNNANAVIAENQEALHKAVQDLSVFTAALARNADSIDEVVNNTKQATASIRDLAGSLDQRTADIASGVTKLTDNLDQRTADITTGVNKLTETATKQIEIVGGDAHRTLIHIDKAVSDLAKNPQRILFGSGR
jgi:phospholipid/cholesterol/gamma-HCH transport system substrate-binding protein